MCAVPREADRTTTAAIIAPAPNPPRMPTSLVGTVTQQTSRPARSSDDCASNPQPNASSIGLAFRGSAAPTSSGSDENSWPRLSQVCYIAGMRSNAVALGRVKETYTTGARQLASRSIIGARPHPRHPERPHGGRRLALRASRRCSSSSRTGTSCCSSGSARSSSSRARCSTSSTARSPARAARRRPSARSSTRPPTASARASCSARSPTSSPATASDVFVVVSVAAVAGSFLVSYTRARAEALGLRGDVGIGSRAERVVVITAGLVLAPWGVAALGDRRAHGHRVDHRRSSACCMSASNFWRLEVS